MPDGRPLDASLLVEQILNYTKVDVRPLTPEPGQRMTVETIPGVLPFIPQDFASQFNIPMTGPVEVLMEAAVRHVNFSVRYKVLVNGKEMTSLKLEPLTGGSLPDSDPLMALIRLPPPILSWEEAKDPLKAELVATVRAEIEGNAHQKDISVPLELIPIALPTLLLLTGNNKVFGMTRAGGPADLSAAVTAINSAIQALNAVRGIADFGPAAAVDGFIKNLNRLTATIASGGPVGLAIEEAPDLDEYDDFDDEADQAVLFGPIGSTEVRLYSGQEFNTRFAGENERTTLRLEEKHDIGKEFGIETGWGFLHDTDWFGNRNWDTDPEDDNMDDVESCRFYDEGDPFYPGDPEYEE